MAAVDPSDPIYKQFQLMRVKDPAVRRAVGLELKTMVATAISEIPPDAVGEFWNDRVMPRVFELVKNPRADTDILAGILATELLCEIPRDDKVEGERTLFRFFNYIRPIMPHPDMNVMIEAAHALGVIAERGGANFADHFIPYEVPRAIEGLQPGQPENSRWIFVLVLKELARHSPAYFHTQVYTVLNYIWVLLRDSRVYVREAAAELLSACLDILRERDKHMKDATIQRLVGEASAGFSLNTPEAIHGSLIAYRSLFMSSDMSLRDSFVECTELVWRYREYKDQLIRRTVVSLMPMMAFYDTHSFSVHFLHRVMGFLMGQLKKTTDRSPAFLAIGHIAIAVTSEMKVFLDQIVVAIKDGLSQHGRKAPLDVEPIFQCVGFLSTAVGPNLTKHMHDILDLMFTHGLSESLWKALEDIVKYIPPLLRTIQDRLLNLLSQTLCGHNYKPPGLSSTGVRVHHAPIQRVIPTTTAPGAKKETDATALALTVLGSFDFTGHALSDFVRTCALPYLEDDDPKTRQAAALTSCQLFMRDPICHQTSNHATRIISDVLDKLLAVGVADPDPITRQKVLGALDERFDRHLSQAENIRSIFIGMNDEVFANRQIAVRLIGRLAVHNPACVMPSLRKAIIQLLTEMEYSNVTRSKEEAAKLLTLLIAVTQRLIKPYAVAILQVLLPKVKDKSTAVATHVLICLGELAVIGGEDLAPHVHEVMDLVLANLQDQSSFPKREAALKALGSVCSHAGYVIDPYLDYPQLLPLLIRFLNETERKPDFRREVIKVMGILGAIDPYKNKNLHNREDDISHATVPANIFDLAMLMNTAGATSEEFYQTVAINALVNLLKDHTQHDVHQAVIDGILSIYQTQGLKCIAFLPHIIPAFLKVIRSPGVAHHDFYIQKLSTLIGIIKQHIRSYLPDVISVFTDLWSIRHPRPPLVNLVEALARALEGEFKVHLPTILPCLLQSLEEESVELEPLNVNVLHAFYTFGPDVEEYMHLVLPAILRVSENPETPPNLRKTAIQTIGRMSKLVNFADHGSRIVHSLARILAVGTHELRMAVMDTLCALLFQLGSDFTVFISMINKSIVKNKIQHPNYEKLVTRLLNGEPLPQEFGAVELFDQDKQEAFAAPELSTMTVNQQHLKQAWDVSQVGSSEDWTEWIRHLAVELLRESPSHALRACAQTASQHLTVARELFNAAFISCWGQLYDTYQEDFVRSIEIAITSPDVPPEIINVLLSLAEFMEHDDRPLAIGIRTLGRYALQYHAYAKALHYKELEFIQEKEKESSSQLIEDLINVNTKLQQPDAAWGTLVLAREEYNMVQQEEWYEKLGRWQEALDAYHAKESYDMDSPQVAIGKMRCYHALGEWAQLSEQVQTHWVNADQDERREVAPLAAAAAWSQHNWDLMDDYISAMKLDTPDRSFYRAILAVHRNQFGKAAQQINKARDLLDNELTGLIRESYGRAYSCVVRIQMLSELEEIIEYKQRADQPDVLKTMQRTWTKRLRGCQPDVEVWQRVLQVRSLVLSPAEDVDTWIKFANLCRKSDRMFIAEKTLNSLLGRGPPRIQDDKVFKAPPAVIYAHLKYMWAEGGHREGTLEYLRDFSDRLAMDLGLSSNDNAARISELVASARMNEFTELLARCYLKQGLWQVSLNDQWRTDNPSSVLQAYYLATQFDPGWYKAWHTWALANFDVVSQADDPNTAEGEAIPDTSLVQHIVAAIQGFFRSIALRTDNSLQDTLRLLTLWFKYGQHADVGACIADGFSTVSVDTWLEVIPQIIARIQMPNPSVRRLVNQVLADVGKAHPQALVYPLAVASKSPSMARMKAALAVMDRMREHSRVIVEQALIVSQELVRVAILWHEMWYEALEEASRIYFGDKNPEGMIAHLEPLHDLLDKGPVTFREVSFMQGFGSDLRSARELCRRFRTYGETSDLNKAWDLYYVVFRRIQKNLPHLNTIELQYTSPELLRARNLQLAVPGTYRSGKPVIAIASFNMTLTVIPSKQRPRKMSLKGSDGREYQYVLKGHEDLRQDERVMQFFGLVNTLLSVDAESFKRHLHIQRYLVIPLSPNSGLLGWVQNSDTLHVLIKEYREARQILLNIEQRLMLQMAPDYENLPLLQKVEVFEYALDNTTGQDLYRVLWLKSANSEGWLERRSTYTRSLAVTSMVGHILGLGDRHPSNLLVDRLTGKVIHIDFGDCFEVAMHRDKYPEKVPFRLTRMLTHAMEVSGIHGSYKNTCEITMQVLRDNKESLMALMEAFVYDPLINWRLMQDADDRVNARAEGEGAAEGSRPQGPTRRARADENEIFDATDGNPRQEARNERAVAVFNRVQNKLTGRDFNPDVELTVTSQVEKLIAQATSLENLCTCFMGWCAFW